MGTIGFGEHSTHKSLHVLNRKFEVGQDADGCYVDVIPDDRHAEKGMEELGLKGAKLKPSTTPREKVKDEIVFAGARTPKLDKAGQTAYRSVAMRISYLSHDRGDLAELAKYLAQKMSSPTEYDFTVLKRAARYLLGRPKARLRYREQPFPDHIMMYSDADWAGCPITRKSTTGMVCFLGSHCLKLGSTLQSLISLSVGESESYALVKTFCVGNSIQSLCADLGLYLKLRIRSDPSTAHSITNRLGVARTKHMDSRYLWVQDCVQAGRLSCQHWPGRKNPADVGTKPVSRADLDRHCAKTGLLFL